MLKAERLMGSDVQIMSPEDDGSHVLMLPLQAEQKLNVRAALYTGNVSFFKFAS